MTAKQVDCEIYIYDCSEEELAELETKFSVKRWSHNGTVGLNIPIPLTAKIIHYFKE